MLLKSKALIYEVVPFIHSPNDNTHNGLLITKWSEQYRVVSNIVKLKPSTLFMRISHNEWVIKIMLNIRIVETGSSYVFEKWYGFQLDLEYLASWIIMVH